MFFFNALHIYKKKLLMVLRTFYEMENVFYIDPCISKSEFNLGVLEDFLVKIRDFWSIFLYISIYLVNIYLHTEILTPRSSKSVKNSSLYDFLKKWGFNFRDFRRVIYPLLSPWRGIRGSIWENSFEYHESTWSVGLKNAITLRPIFQNPRLTACP